MQLLLVHQPFPERKAVDHSFPAVPIQTLPFAFKGFFVSAMQELVQEHIKKKEVHHTVE